MQTIQAQIRNGFSQPELSVKLIAAKLGVSPRYVRELLHKAGTTFTDRVKDLRLQKAHAMLTDRNCDHLMTSPMPAASARSRTSTAASVSGSVTCQRAIANPRPCPNGRARNVGLFPGVRFFATSLRRLLVHWPRMPQSFATPSKHALSRGSAKYDLANRRAQGRDRNDAP